MPSAVPSSISAASSVFRLVVSAEKATFSIPVSGEIGLPHVNGNPSCYLGPCSNFYVYDGLQARELTCNFILGSRAVLETAPAAGAKEHSV